MSLHGYTPAVYAERSTLTRNELIVSYFKQGFSYVEILSFVTLHHGHQLSLRQLKRVLKANNLFRKKDFTDMPQVISAVKNVLESASGCDKGYRYVAKVLRDDHGLRVRRDDIRLLLGIMDPEGVAYRKKNRLRRRQYVNKGPNYMWHVDGNDKLKPYGFAIHGAIDGFSRRMLWLEVAATNKKPELVAQFFLKTVKELKGTARTVRMDPGTENGHLADLQTVLAGERGVIFGKSTGNQRIESWWAYCKRSTLSWWINFFKDLGETQRLNFTDNMTIECLRFCYMGILRRELQELVEKWNTHRIRHSRNRDVPSGIPDLMYFMPVIKGTKDYKKSVDSSELEIMRHHTPALLPESCLDANITRLLNELLVSWNGEVTTVTDATRFFVELSCKQVF